VSQDQVTEGRPTLNFLNYKKSETEYGFSEMCDDIQSINSVSDDIDSLAEPNLKVADFRHAAVTYFVSLLTESPETLALYEQASQRMGEAKFVRNHRRLLKKYFLELRTETQTASQRSAIEFLRFRPNRTQISQGIFNLVISSNNSIQEQISILPKQENDSLVILDRFLGDLGETDSLERPTTPPTIIGSNTHIDAGPTGDDSDDDDSSIGDQHSYQFREDNPLSHFKATTKFFTTGQPFRVYQDHLRRFLNPHVAAELVKITQPHISENNSRVPSVGCVEELSANTVKFRTIISFWWFRLMNFCCPPPTGYHRIPYLCVSDL
jgi:hypothetical protein